MKLKEYFEETGIKQSFFANKIGATRQQLFHWIHGDNLPSLPYAYLIEKQTGGKVTFKDWIKDKVDLK